jgi:hypothetical protein
MVACYRVRKKEKERKVKKSHYRPGEVQRVPWS